MKNIILSAAFAGTLTLHVSCGEKGTEATGAAPGAAERAESPAAQAEVHALKVLETVERVPKAIMTITDEASLESARMAIDEVVGELADQAEVIKEMPEMSNDEKAALSDKMESESKRMDEKMIEAMNHVGELEDPELQQKIGMLMQDFATRMNEVGSVMSDAFEPSEDETSSDEAAE